MKWLGLVPTTKSITAVVLDDEDGGDRYVVGLDISITVGSEPAAYDIAYRRVQEVVRESGVDAVIVKASSTGGRLSKGILSSAEVRGVAIAAACSECHDVRVVSKAQVSKSFGDRKIDSYISDSEFWADKTQGELLKGSREAAMLVMFAASEGSD